MNCPSCQAENEPAASVCTACRSPLEAPTAVVVSVDLSPGTLLDGRYQLQEPLGRGGMGMVYRARDRMLDETVAIKVLRPDFAQDPRMAERFRSEIKLARKVRHHNVCAIHDYGEYRGLLYISMELVEGVDLKRVIREHGALPRERAYAVAIQIAEGLQAVHDVAIVHRDLKAPNIMLDGQGRARLMDFGIAKRQGAEGGTLTATGQVVGTPEYMSPEQAQGHKVDFRSDLYALGAVVYEIFSGRVPFRGETPISTILKHLHEPPPLDDPAAAGIPLELRPLLRQALAKEPGRRPGSAREFALELARARDGAEPADAATTRIETRTTVETPRRPGLHPRFRAGIVSLASVAAVAIGVVLLRPHSPVPSLAPAATLALAPAAAPAPRPTATPPLPVPAAPSRRSPSPPTAREARPTPAATAAATPAVPPTAVVTPRPAAAEPGQLLVAVRPWGEVSIDGKTLGTTPLDRIAMPPGEHRVSIRHPAYETWEGRAVVRSGQLERLIVDLPTQGVRRRP